MKKKFILIFFLVVIVVGVGIVAYVFISKLTSSKDSGSTTSYEVLESVTIESGEELPSVQDFFKDKAPSKAEIRYFYGSIDVTDNEGIFYYKKGTVKYSIGTYEIDVEIVGNFKYKSKLIIKDTTSPKVKLKDLEVYSYTQYDAKDFVAEYEDNSGLDEYTAEFLEIIYDEPGEYKMPIKVCDLSNNCTEEKGNLVIVPGETKVGSFKVTYGRYVGEICDEVAGIHNCQLSVIYVLGDKIKLNDGTLKRYIVEGNNLILSNTEVFKVIDENKLEYQNSLKSIYVYREE